MRGNNKRLEFDDYIQYLPVATSLMLGCTGVKARHSLKDRASPVGGGYYGFELQLLNLEMNSCKNLINSCILNI